MTAKTASILTLVGVLTLAGAASAQPWTISNGQVGISGATLFENFFKSASVTNDAVNDTDGDGVVDFTSPDVVDQLAAGWSSFSSAPPTYGTNQASGQSYFYVHYRGTSSGSGFGELLNYHDSGTSPTSTPADDSYINRQQFYDSELGTFLNGAVNANIISNARIDIAIMDVPTTWMVQNGSSSNATAGARPTNNGYGYCPTTSWDQGQAQQLKSLTVGSTTYNTNTSSPDSNTIFDTQVAYVPVSFIVNPGVLSVDRAVDESDSSDFDTTGDYSLRSDGKLVGLKKTELQALFATGRMDTGENLVAATRNAGSGTRNAAMNSIELDPSWGRGDNMGVEASSSGLRDLDPDFNANFMTSSSRMQEVVSRGRLVVGYQGLEKAEKKSAEDGHETEHAAIMNDLASEGGTKYVFPTIDNIIDNGNVDNGWRIGGNETMVTVGDPQATSGDAQMTGGEQPAAEFINNITDSIANFSGSVGSDENYFMPGEYIAVNYMASGALEMAPKSPTAGWVDQRTGTGDGSQNTGMATYIKTNSNLDTDEFGTYGVKAPVRGSSYEFDDGANSAAWLSGNPATTGYLYYSDASGTLAVQAGGQDMDVRNTVQGDFSGDDIRDINDITDMVNCLEYTPNTGDGTQNLSNAVLAWAFKEADGVMPHIIGDYNNDGDFDAEDVRYFADGLAYDSTKTVGARTGLINRVQAFQDVDNASDGNFFNVTKANGTYAAGDAMFDVAGSDASATLFGATPGAAPNGADNTIDGFDISYVQKVLQGLPGTPGDQNADDTLSWFNTDGTVNLDEAISMDLSVDFDGDFDNDSADLQALFDALGTGMGDASIDGEVNDSDLNLLLSSWNQTGKAWGNGDFSADGLVNDSDLNLLLSNWNGDYDGGSNMTVTPEPATMTLLGLGGLAMLRRRRRK